MPRRGLSKNPDAPTGEWLDDFPGAPLSDEPPRQVFLDACAQIAAAMQEFGFKYAKDQQVCLREHHGFGNTIGFQSSRSNVRGLHVGLSIYASVSSEVLRAWQEARLPTGPVTRYFAGGMVHLLGDQYAMLQWELADPADRAATIADAISFIRETVIPYFTLFERPTALIRRLQDTEVPAFWLCPSVDFAHCFGDKQQAQQVLDLSLIHI